MMTASTHKKNSKKQICHSKKPMFESHFTRVVSGFQAAPGSCRLILIKAVSVAVDIHSPTASF
jgi:hypothetical protein